MAYLRAGRTTKSLSSLFDLVRSADSRTLWRGLRRTRSPTPTHPHPSTSRSTSSPGLCLGWPKHSRSVTEREKAIGGFSGRLFSSADDWDECQATILRRLRAGQKVSSHEKDSCSLISLLARFAAELRRRWRKRWRRPSSRQRIANDRVGDCGPNTTVHRNRDGWVEFFSLLERHLFDHRVRNNRQQWTLHRTFANSLFDHSDGSCDLARGHQHRRDRFSDAQSG